MDAETVIELMSSAPERYNTVRAAMCYRGNGSAINTSREQYLDSELGRRETVGLVGAYQASDPPEPKGLFEWRCRVWYASVSPGTRDDCYRVELELPESIYPGGATHIYTWNGADEVLDRRIDAVSSTDDPKWLRLARDSFWTTYPFDPDGIAGLSFFLDHLDLKIKGVVQKAGREAIRMVGLPVEAWELDPDPLQWGGDEYEILVDKERGVLLHCASQIGGDNIDSFEVEEIYFDESFPKNVFTASEPLPWLTCPSSKT